MRNQLASHVYDITYGSVRAGGDNLVCVDDSIVRGTTLRRSILRILARLNPRKIVIVSTAPQIRYPGLLRHRHVGGREVHRLRGRDRAAEGAGPVRACSTRCTSSAARRSRRAAPSITSASIYEPFTPEDISAQIVELVRPAEEGLAGRNRDPVPEDRGLHAAVPLHTGDWYFTGKYPTPGGYRVVNQAYVNYYEKSEGRSY